MRGRRRLHDLELLGLLAAQLDLFLGVREVVKTWEGDCLEEELV